MNLEAMTSRNRTRVYDARLQQWYFLNGTHWLPDNVITCGKDTCADVIGDYGGDHPLSITHDFCDGGGMDWLGSYHIKGQAHGYLISGAPLDESGFSTWLAQFSAQKIVAASAPTRPSVYNLTNLLEIRDIPHLIKHAGDFLHHLNSAPAKLFSPRAIANSTLAWQFGWAPLLDDIKKCMAFGKHVADRQRQLTDLANHKVAHRRAKFGSCKVENYSTRTVFSSGGVIITTKVTSSRELKCWGTVRWRYLDRGLAGKKPTWLSAFNQLYGITAGEVPVQVWKALPWTWFIDWFANISDSLEVSKNLLSYTPSNVCKMYTNIYKHVFDPVKGAGPNQTYDGAVVTNVSKVRQPLSGESITGIHLHVPFLDAYKLSVLGSLAVLRLPGGR